MAAAINANNYDVRHLRAAVKNPHGGRVYPTGEERPQRRVFYKHKIVCQNEQSFRHWHLESCAVARLGHAKDIFEGSLAKDETVGATRIARDSQLGTGVYTTDVINEKFMTAQRELESASTTREFALESDTGGLAAPCTLR